METRTKYGVGDAIGGFTVERVEPLEHLKGTYYELTHGPTGARHIHIEAPDDSKAFCVNFPTVPKDSRGVAHILEHVVLAGSRRFPVRDPFFSMLSRSVRDFMNAMTFYDSTAYPYSTRNAKDFFNLLDVYLDAVFFPLITEPSFKQEGHRLEFEETGDPASGLRIKGVVFNEMKGGMASDAAVLHRAVGKALFPGSTYANNSGGDPEHIPDLTWQDLRDFHALHYHPSNARFFTYGDLPLEELLERIETSALKSFERIQVDVDIPDQPRFTEPVVYEDVYPLAKTEDTDRKSQVMLAWVTNKLSDSFETLALEILGDILLANAASPLRQALIDSGLGSALADGSGFRDSYREAAFTAGLKGVDPEDAEQIEQIVLSTLERLATDGVDPEQVEAAVHQQELATREVSNSGFPYALKVWFYMKAAYDYGGDPYRALQLDADFERLHAELAKGGFFEGMIRRYLLDNPHRARIIVRPDQELEDRQRAAEESRIAEIEERLSEDDKRSIVEETLALKGEQEARQDLSVLPTLDPADIPVEDDDIPLLERTINGARVAFAPQPTNSLTYITIAADISGLPQNLKDRLGLFARAIPRTGAAGHDYLRQSLRIDRYTGGIDAGPQVRTGPDGTQVFQQLLVQGKALGRNDEAFVEILRDILASLTFEPDRLKDIIAEYRSQFETYLTMAGMRYAELMAKARLTGPGALLERLSGLTQLHALRELNGRGADLDETIADLTAVREAVFRGGGLQVVVTADDDRLAGLEGLVTAMLADLPSDATPSGGLPEPVGGERFPARTTGVPVAYNARVLKTVPFEHPDAPALMALGKWLRNFFLHREIREKGGAYGSHSAADVENGTFTFWSYRDPHVARTFETFERSAREAAADLDPEQVKEAVLQALSDVDPLLSPDMKGRRRFFDEVCGYTREVRRGFREGLLEVTPADIARVATTYLAADGAVLASVGNAQKLEEANATLGGIFDVEPA